MVNYNISGGKRFRSSFCRSLLATFDHKQPLEVINSFELCLEILQACCLMADDMVDESPTRRGRPSWHTVVGLQAINDIGLLRETANYIVKQNLGHHSNYAALLDLISEATRIAYCGQTLDMMTSDNFKQSGDFSSYTLDVYQEIMKMKGGFTTFVGPTRLALLIYGKTDQTMLLAFDHLAIRLAELHGMQDDMIDVYGDETLTGKKGTDIVNAKCAWPIVTALSLATEEQRNILIENFGKADEECEQKVKSVFDELDIKSLFKEKEKQMSVEITKEIDKLCKEYEVNPIPFKDLLKLLMNRKK